MAIPKPANKKVTFIEPMPNTKKRKAAAPRVPKEKWQAAPRVPKAKGHTALRVKNTPTEEDIKAMIHKAAKQIWTQTKLQCLVANLKSNQTNIPTNHPQTIFAVFDKETGKHLEYRQHKDHPKYKEVWKNCFQMRLVDWPKAFVIYEEPIQYSSYHTSKSPKTVQ